MTAVVPSFEDSRPTEEFAPEGSFTNSGDALTSSPPSNRDSYRALDGCRVVVAGFGRDAGVRLLEIFQSVGAFSRLSAAPVVAAAGASCDLMIASLAGFGDQISVLESIAAPVIAGVSLGSSSSYLPWISESAVDCLFLPCSDEEILTRAVMAIHARHVRPGRKSDEKFRILLADDTPVITTLLKATLESDRMECRCTPNGADALQIAREWGPDLAVLDVNMPGLDGYQVLSALRQERKPIPVLLLTGRDQESEVIKGFKLGAADYVVKPFNPIEILMRVKRILALTA